MPIYYDEEQGFWMKWIFGLIGVLLFIFIGYLITPENFTSVLMILIGAIMLGLVLNEWGTQHKL